jgi:hypothetical protein
VRGAWWHDLHNYRGGWTLDFTVIHLAVSYMDENLGLGLVEITLPWGEKLNQVRA